MTRFEIGECTLEYGHQDIYTRTDPQFDLLEEEFNLKPLPWSLSYSTLITQDLVGTLFSPLFVTLLQRRSCLFHLRVTRRGRTNGPCRNAPRRWRRRSATSRRPMAPATVPPSALRWSVARRTERSGLSSAELEDGRWRGAPSCERRTGRVDSQGGGAEGRVQPVRLGVQEVKLGGQRMGLEAMQAFESGVFAPGHCIHGA